jgi:hypothetical protein
MFIDEWFGADYYQKLPLGYHKSFQFGQLFWTHAYYPHENLELWRPVVDSREPTKTFASDFQIRPAGQDAFKRSIPLSAPKLETNEEFIVIRAKVRPVLLLHEPSSWAGVDNRGYRGRVGRPRVMVAQIFGLADAATNRAEFSPTFVDRVRRMEFPELMFLPKFGTLEVDSLLRLDEIQSVFVPHLHPTEFSLATETLEILRGQLQYLIAKIGPTPYTELREILVTS